MCKFLLKSNHLLGYIERKKELNFYIKFLFNFENINYTSYKNISKY
jgi:hypothetical protein